MHLSLHKRRLAAALAGVAAMIGAVACSGDSAVSPIIDQTDTQSSTSQLGQQLAASGDSTLWVPTLTYAVPLAQDVTVSGVIDRAGGYFGIPEAGVWLYVPDGTVREPTTFTITAKAGSAVAFDFGPAGSNFADKYVVIVQELQKTNWGTMADPLAIQGGYFKADTLLDAKRGGAGVSEFVQTQVDVKHARALVFVNHFSGYVIATANQ